MKTEETMEVGAFEAKNRLSALVDMAASGKRIWITKRGKRMALLSSGLERQILQEDDVLLESMRALRIRSVKGKESLKDLVEEGRR